MSQGDFTNLDNQTLVRHLRGSRQPRSLSCWRR